MSVGSSEGLHRSYPYLPILTDLLLPINRPFELGLTVTLFKFP